jgi:hypothetical protein
MDKNLGLGFGKATFIRSTALAAPADMIVSSPLAILVTRTLLFATLTFNGKRNPAGSSKAFPPAPAGTTTTSPIQKRGNNSMLDISFRCPIVNARSVELFPFVAAAQK